MNIGIDVYRKRVYIAYSLDDGILKPLLQDDGNEVYEIEDNYERQFFKKLFYNLEKKFANEEYYVYFAYDKNEIEISKYCDIAGSEGFKVVGSCERTVLPAIVYRSHIHDSSKVNVIFAEEEETKLYCLEKKKSGYSISPFAYSCEYEETYRTNNLLSRDISKDMTINVSIEADKQARMDKIENYISNSNRKTIIVGKLAGEFTERLKDKKMLVKTEPDKSTMVVAYGAAICNNSFKLPTIMKLATRLEVQIAISGKKHGVILFERGQEIEESIPYKKNCVVEVRNNASMDISVFDDGVMVNSFTIRCEDNDSNNVVKMHSIDVVGIIGNGNISIQIYEEILSEQKGLFSFLTKKSSEKKKEIEISF